MERRLPNRAAHCYEKGEQWDLAAELYEKHGDHKRAEECYLKVKNKAAVAKMYAQQGNSEKAAQYFKELGRHKEAGEHFEKLGKKAEALECYQQVYQMLATRKPGSGDRDIGVEREGKELLTKLCKLWDESGQTEKAAEFLLKAGNADAAAEYFRKAGKLDKAAKLLEEAGHLEQAARIYKELGKETEATTLFARSFQDRGQHEQAAELYAKSGELLIAAELFEKSEKTERAAELFLQAKDPRRAADLYAKLGDYAKAASLYEQGKQWSAAVFCYEQLGQWVKVGEMWERIGNPFLSGVTYFTCKEPQRAVKALEQVPENSDDFKESRRLLAIMLLELGRAKDALPHFDAGFGRKIEKDDVEAFYYYAQALEQFSDLQKKATSAFETIEKLKPGYRDVKKRIAALKTGHPLPATSIYADGEADPTSLFHTSRFSLRSTGDRARPSDPPV
jgi:tetratricopeptide (TPR) repeat protein